MNFRSFANFQFDGKAALECLAVASEYGSLQQAVASLAVFTNPEAVKETRGMNLFPVIRGIPRGRIVNLNGRSVLLDDNSTPANIFMWASGLGDPRPRDVQFNHLDHDATDVRHYTSLSNVCLTPAFLARVTDTKTSREIQRLLRYHASSLYGEFCVGAPTEEPPGYRNLQWAPCLDYKPEMEKRIRRVLKRRPKQRATIAAREIGWFFTDFRPDPSV